MIFLICALHGCATKSGSSNAREATIIEPNTAKIANAFPQVRHRKVIYKDSYVGNFTFYYSPVQIDADYVEVPEVSCYTYASGEMGGLDRRKCTINIARRNFAFNARYVFELGESVSIVEAKKVAFAWYEKNRDDGRYIESLYSQEGIIKISLSGGACSGSLISVSKNHLGEYVFYKDEAAVEVCS